MPYPPDLVPAPAPVAEIERRLRWRVLAMLAFLGILLALAVVAAVGLLAPPRAVTGLPDDPDVRAAADLVRDRLKLDTGSLRFRSSLLGDGGGPRRPGEDERLARAEALLARARARAAGDPRLLAAAASLDLARHRWIPAERRYRAALDRGVRFGEARLGLGVTLAMRAAGEADPLRRRGLALQAIAQLAEVDEADPVHDVALYDRALLLAGVGRTAEARRLARAYLARDSTSVWAERLAREVGAG